MKYEWHPFLARRCLCLGSADSRLAAAARVGLCHEISIDKFTTLMR